MMTPRTMNENLFAIAAPIPIPSAAQSSEIQQSKVHFKEWVDPLNAEFNQ